MIKLTVYNHFALTLTDLAIPAFPDSYKIKAGVPPSSKAALANANQHSIIILHTVLKLNKNNPPTPNPTHAQKINGL